MYRSTRFPLALKLIFLIVVTVLVVLGLGFHLISQREETIIVSEIREKVSVVSKITQHSVAEIFATIQEHENNLKALPQRITALTDVNHLILMDDQGNVLAEHRKDKSHADLEKSIRRHIGQILDGAPQVNMRHTEWGIYHRFVPLLEITASNKPKFRGVIGVEWSAQQAHESIEHDAETVTNLVQEFVGQQLRKITASRTLLQETVQTLGHQSGINHVEVFGRDGEIVAHTRPEHVGQSIHPEHVTLVKRVMATGQDMVEMDLERGVFNYFAPVIMKGSESTNSPAAVIQVVSEPTALLGKITELKFSLYGLGLALSLVLATFLFGLTQRIIIKPIRSLSRAMRSGDFSTIDISDTQDELSQFSQEFKLMDEQRRQARLALESSEKRTRGIINSTIDGIITIDEKGIIQSFNWAAEKMFGYDANDVIGNNVSMLMPEPHRSSHDKYIHNYMTTGIRKAIGSETEVDGLHSDGSTFPLALRISEMIDDNVKLFVGIAQDITERREAFSRLDYKASHDDLTGLPNRMQFHDRLEVAVTKAQRNKDMVGLMFLDLNRFKQVNDTFGHDVGDQLLKEVAQRLKQSIRQSDTVARLSGDEFTIILEEVTEPEALDTVANKILLAFKHPFSLANRELPVTTSIGIAVYPSDEQNLDALLTAADTAMYHAKQRGMNQYAFYSQEMMIESQRRQAIEHEIMQAWDNNEFEVFFQPIIDVNTKKVIGTEALLRWRHPEKGLLLPNEFLSVFDQIGLIMDVTDWVMQQVGKLYHRLLEVGTGDVFLAVNLPRCMLKGKTMLGTVVDFLSDSDIDPDKLVLEITEDALVMDLRDADVALRTIQGMGVRFALDDFGAGQSSLGHLRRTPVDIIKIDRDLISTVAFDETDATMARSVIEMAHSLGKTVIIEGVETQEQLAFLEQNNCDAAQGYLFSKAVDADTFIAAVIIEQS